MDLSVIEGFFRCPSCNHMVSPGAYVEAVENRFLCGGKPQPLFYAGSLDRDRCIVRAREFVLFRPPPEPEKWVPPKRNHADTYAQYITRVVESLAEWVNGRLDK